MTSSAGSPVAQSQVDVEAAPKSEHGNEAGAPGAERSNLDARPRGWRFPVLAFVVALVAVVGMGVFMYPSTAAWWASFNQARAVAANQELVVADTFPGNAQRIADARQYNELLNSGAITVGADANKPTTEGSDDMTLGLEYEDLLAGTSGMMARIKIPSIGVDLPVYHGTSDEVLLKGAGHLQGTSLPVGGPGTRSVISAHRGLATATMFNDLNKLKVGDSFVVETFGEVLTYRVIETQVVDPSDTRTVLPREGEDLVTLVTCTPLGINTHRILVTGERVFPTPIGDVEAAGAESEVPGFPWWAVILPTGVVLAGIYVWRSGYPPKPKKKVANSV